MKTQSTSVSVGRFDLNLITIEEKASLEICKKRNDVAIHVQSNLHLSIHQGDGREPNFIVFITRSGMIAKACETFGGKMLHRITKP